MAKEPKSPNVFAECIRCGCAFAYYRKPKMDDNGNPIERPADHVERGGTIPCPGCNYYAPELLARDKAAAFFTLLFFAVFPALMMMFAKPLANQASIISSDTADTLFTLCVYAAGAIGVIAVLGGLFYHPTQAPFNKLAQQAKLLREGRPREEWHQPQETPVAAPEPMPGAAAPAADATAVDDIAPPADFVPPKTLADDDEEEDRMPLTPPMPAPPTPRPMPHAATGAPIGGTGAPGSQSAGDMIVLQCPQCHKKFRAPRAMPAGTPKCKVCQVVLIDVSAQRVG